MTNWSNTLFPHPGWIAARAPHREHRQNFDIFYIFSVHGKNCLRWLQIGPGYFFPLLIQTLPTFWAERIWILRIYISLFLSIPTFRIFRSPDLKISRFPNAAGGVGAGRTLRSQTDPSPNASRDQIRRKEPLLRCTSSVNIAGVAAGRKAVIIYQKPAD